tara:strand:+ start:87 stop:242 length:156 start_codon:yes stop_codon:yes gene_type:complete
MSDKKPNITPQNGKGDSNRTTNLKKFQENYKKIKWQRPSGKLPNIPTEDTE